MGVAPGSGKWIRSHLAATARSLPFSNSFHGRAAWTIWTWPAGWETRAVTYLNHTEIVTCHLGQLLQKPTPKGQLRIGTKQHFQGFAEIKGKKNPQTHTWVFNSRHLRSKCHHRNGKAQIYLVLKTCSCPLVGGLFWGSTSATCGWRGRFPMAPGFWGAFLRAAAWAHVGSCLGCPLGAGEDHISDSIDVSGAPAVDVHQGRFSTVTVVIVMLTAVTLSKMFVAEIQLEVSQAIWFTKGRAAMFHFKHTSWSVLVLYYSENLCRRSSS